MILLSILSSCSTPGSRPVRLSFELPLEFSAKGSEPVPEQWWDSLDDDQLNQVIDEALADNFSIRSAWDRLTQAEQIAVQIGASLFPVVTYGAGAERIRRRVSDNVTYTSDYYAGIGAAYEIDLWNRIGSARQAAVLDTQAASENVSAAAMTLTSAIAKTWYQLAEAKRQQEIISQQIQTNEKILEVIKLQFRKAKVGAADVFSQEQLVQSGRGKLIQTQEDIALLQHQLSILMGRTPSVWWESESIDLITLKQLPKIDIPAVVIQRRPDVLTAYLAIQAADQRMASAIADQYPTISLSAGAETSAAKVYDLFDDWLGNLAANLSGPLFDAGLRKAEVKRTRAILSEKLNDYNQTVLEALKETEDAIQQEYYQRQYVESLQKQLTLAQNVYERTYQNYLKGQLDYIRVLTSLVTMQNLERNELTARRILIEHRIDLCRSIAGGWPMRRPVNAELLGTSFLDNKE
jgi:NodT family efflux transporter outer membrane factor (OMF) lipoprotein